MGIITYSSSAIPVFNFKRLKRKYDVLRAVRKIPFPRGRSYTGRALRFAGTYLYSTSSRSRSKVLVVLTGDQSFDSVSRPAQMLKRGGVEIFAFGMGGRRSNRYLSSIAHDRYHVFSARSRLGLRKVIEKLVAKICAATPIRKPTPTGMCFYFFFFFWFNFVVLLLFLFWHFFRLFVSFGWLTQGWGPSLLSFLLSYKAWVTVTVTVRPMYVLPSYRRFLSCLCILKGFRFSQLVSNCTLRSRV